MLSLVPELILLSVRFFIWNVRAGGGTLSSDCEERVSSSELGSSKGPRVLTQATLCPSKDFREASLLGGTGCRGVAFNGQPPIPSVGTVE